MVFKKMFSAGIRLTSNAFFFMDTDPHFMWKVGELAKKESELKIKMQIEYLSADSAGKLYAGFGLKGKLGSGR